MQRVVTSQLVSHVLESSVGRITLAGHIRNNPGIARPRVFGSYAAVYVLFGSGRYQDARGERRITAGDLLIVFPEIEHAYGPSQGEQWDEIYVVFDGPIFDTMRSRQVLRPEGPILHVEPVEYWHPRWQAVVTEPGNTQPEALTAIGRLVQVLLESADAARRDRIGDLERKWVEHAKALLEGELPLERIAEEMGASYVAFRKRFAVLAGMPPGHYRTRKIIDRACLLMYADPSRANKSLARECGFANEYHFSRRFKQIVGLSPSQFRTQIGAGAKA